MAWRWDNLDICPGEATGIFLLLVQSIPGITVVNIRIGKHRGQQDVVGVVMGHKDNIYVIENATFDNNLQYLLSMGVKSFAEILRIEPKDIDELPTLGKWLEERHAKLYPHS